MRSETTPSQMTVFLVTHVVIPASIILMVCAFLFFLIDLRAVLFDGGGFLKMVGANFVVAAVLIVRYARTHRHHERRYVYLAALAAVTVIAMTSFNNMNGRVLGRGEAGADLFLSLLIVGAVWWLATALTECLSLEHHLDAEPESGTPLVGMQMRAKPRQRLEGRAGVEAPSPQPSPLGGKGSRMAGVEAPSPQLSPAGGRGNRTGQPQAGEGRRTPTHARTHRSRPAKPGATSAWLGIVRILYRSIRGVEQADRYGNPARAVCRIALVALVVFAFGEPLLLAGAPEVGAQALLAMVTFLFSTGLLLAAASSIGLMRYASRRGGSVSLALIPMRVASGAALLALVLCGALAVPGVRYRGTGELQAQVWETDSSEGARTDGERQARDLASSPRAGAGGGDEAGDGPGAAPVEAAGDVAPGLLDGLASMGTMLLRPLLFGGLLFGFFTLLGMRAFWSEWARRARAGCAALLMTMRRLLERRRLQEAVHQVDPLSGYEALNQLAPDEAVCQAYARFMDLAGALGHARPPRLTPLEFLRHLPMELRAHQKDLKTLTELYNLAAYSARGVGAAEKAVAMGILKQLRERS